MDTGGPFSGGKARPGRDADHSPPSSAEVVNEQELYFLSPQAPPWRVTRLLYFTFYMVSTDNSVEVAMTTFSFQTLLWQLCKLVTLMF
jgi:hypothetical protein